MKKPFISVLGLSCLLALVSLPAARAQYPAPAAAQDNVSMSDPSEVFLKAFTSVQQGEKLEEDGKLRPALAKYRFAASLLEQLTQTNPSWQPLIVKYRVRKTTENIQKLEDKLSLQPQSEPGADNSSSPASANPGPPTGFPAARPGASDDDLPVPDTAIAGVGMDRSGLSAAAAPDYADRAAADLSARLAKTQKDLKSALDARDAAVKDKQDVLKQKSDLEYQLHSSNSNVKTAQKRFERTKADRDDLQSQVDKLDARLKEAYAKNPEGSNDSRKELRKEVDDLKKSLAKAQEDTSAAAKERDDLTAKLTASETQNGQLTKERDAALAQATGNKESAQKIASLQAENGALTQKLTAAEATIAQLTDESVKKKQELSGLQTELTSLKTQLATSRDQNDRVATTVTELRQQLDDSARHLEELKSTGTTSEEVTHMTHENELLRGIVMRQLKDQARRMQARDLLNNELKRLEVQSVELDKQVTELGRPTMQLTDQERGLFKDPTVTISDSANNPASVAVVISGVKPKGPGASPSASPAAPANNPVASAGKPAASPPARTPPAGGGSPAPASGSPAPGAVAQATAAPADDEPASAPRVDTLPPMPVAAELVPMAREAKESFDRGKYPDAQRTYDKLLAREPKNPYLLANQGVVFLRQEMLKPAEVALKKALAASPKDVFCMSTLGIVYYKMHRYDEAISFLTQALQTDPKNATAHNYLGITSSQKGWQEEAVEELQKAISLNPNYADAHFNIAVVYATYQPPAKDRAQEHYKIATSLGAAPDAVLEKLIKN